MFSGHTRIQTHAKAHAHLFISSSNIQVQKADVKGPWKGLSLCCVFTFTHIHRSTSTRDCGSAAAAATCSLSFFERIFLLLPCNTLLLIITLTCVILSFCFAYFFVCHVTDRHPDGAARAARKASHWSGSDWKCNQSPVIVVSSKVKHTICASHSANKIHTRFYICS